MLQFEDKAFANFGQWLAGQRWYDEEHYVECSAYASLPSRFGLFQIIVFKNSIDNLEHVALVRGAKLFEHESHCVMCRVHSECLTGDVFASLRCDCRQQLEYALQHLGQEDAAVLLYMRQEGRGIGLANKIRAYHLQEHQHLDTVEANQHLGFDDDLRDYRVAAMMLKALSVKRIELFTNNPKKVLGLKAHGIDVCKCLPIVIKENTYNAAYLKTKAQKLGHWLPKI